MVKGCSMSCAHPFVAVLIFNPTACRIWISALTQESKFLKFTDRVRSTLVWLLDYNVTRWNDFFSMQLKTVIEHRIIDRKLIPKIQMRINKISHSWLTQNEPGTTTDIRNKHICWIGSLLFENNICILSKVENNRTQRYFWWFFMERSWQL